MFPLPPRCLKRERLVAHGSRAEGVNVQATGCGKDKRMKKSDSSATGGTKKSKVKTRFDETMIRCNALTALYDTTKNDDLLRAAVVIGVAAMERFLKDRFLELFIPFLKDEQKRKGVGKWNKPTDELLAESGIDADFWRENSLCPAKKILVKLSKQVRDYVRTGIVLQKRKAIEGLYTCYGMGNIIQFAIGKAERKTLWDSVEKLIKRRHQVAHGADYLYAGKLDSVDKKEVVRRLGHVSKLVNSIDEVLQLRFKKNKGKCSRNKKANKKGQGK